MLCFSSSSRGSSLSRDESGLYPQFRVPLPVAPLSELGNPKPWLFVGNKGIPVCCYSWDVDNPRAVVVLVHGYGAHCMYEWLHSVAPEPEAPSEPDAVTESLTREFQTQATIGKEAKGAKSTWNCCRAAVSEDEEEAEILSKGGSSRVSLSRTETLQLVPPEPVAPESVAPLKDTDAAEALKKCAWEMPGRTTTPMVKQASQAQEPSLPGTTPAAPARKLTYSGSWVQRFLNCGWRVIGMDLQSHGASHGWEGKSCQVQVFDDFAQDIKTLLQSLANESSLPIFLVGTSVGGCAAVRAAELLSKAGLLGKPHAAVPQEGEDQNQQQQKQSEGEKQQEQTQTQDQTEGQAQQQSARGSESTGSTVSTQRDAVTVVEKIRKSVVNETLREGVTETQEGEQPAQIDSYVAAAAFAMGASHRVVRQKPVPLAGLVLLSPMLEAPQMEGSVATCLAAPFMNALKSLLPHCGVASRPRNEMFPEVEACFSQDENTFKGKCRINLGMEMQEGLKAAQADAHWLRRPILRDSSEPFSLSDWAKLLHRQMAEAEARERKGLREEQAAKGTTTQQTGQEVQERLKQEQRDLMMMRDEVAPDAQYLCVLLVQSLDDTMVPPLGSVRLFEKLGGRARVPQPWASVLREERRKEREALRAAKAELPEGQAEREATEEGMEEEEEERERRPSAAFEAEFLGRAASHVERIASQDLKEAEIAARMAEMAAAKGDREVDEKIITALEAVKSAAKTIERSSTLDKLAARAERRLTEEKREMAANLAADKASDNADDTTMKGSRTESEDGWEGTDRDEERASSEVCEGLAVESWPEVEGQEPEPPQPPAGEESAKGCCQACCSCCAAEESVKTTTKKKHRKKSKAKKPPSGGGVFGWCTCGGGEEVQTKRAPGLYCKRKRWGAIHGLLVDEHGCLVDVEEANALMEEVRAHGFEPFPELLTRAEDETTDEEEIKEEEELNDEEKAFSRITNIAADGALQLWLLRGNCHMLTKEPGNEDLQKDIIGKFIQPALQKFPVDEPKAGPK